MVKRSSLFERLSRLRASSIRSRLLLLLVLSVVLTALVIGVVTAIFGSRDGRERAVAQLRSVATLKEEEISAWTAGLELNLDIVLTEVGVLDALDVLTGSPLPVQTRETSHDLVRERFLWAAERMGLFVELFFMDTDGAVLVSTDSGHEGQRLALNDYFTEGLEGKYLQQPSYALSLGKMTIVASAPVRAQGRTLGVIAGRADLTGLDEIMIERAGLGETGETYLVGSNYRLLTHLRQPGYSIPDTYIRTPGTETAIEGGADGWARYEGPQGSTVIGVYAWIPQLQVVLMAEQHEAEALGPTRIALAIIASFSILAVLLAILAGIALTRRIVRPLAQLTTTAGRITSGELDLVADVKGEDEIATLAQSFNSMTARLRDLVRNLERRTDHLRAINEAGRHISSILDVDELLPYVARSLLKTFTYDCVRILLLTEDGRGILHACSENAACPEPVVVELNGPNTGDPCEPCSQAIGTVARTGRQLLVEDGAGSYLEIAVPIRIKDKLLGVLDITAQGGHPTDEQDVFAAQTLADQLAVAIENSRLYGHAEELAVTRERQRLARDLHDAVSQTLFSVSLIAEVLPRIYERDPDQGRQRLEELRALTRGALAEMRTLLLELRPAALVEAPLPDLLRQLGEAVISRARIPVEVEADQHCSELPAEVRVAFYHVAQEALNNVAKHSGATKARLELVCLGTEARLAVEDDGTGFDPAHTGAGQLGLGIMRERAESLGGRLDVQSAPGEGTRIVMTWSAQSAPPSR